MGNLKIIACFVTALSGWPLLALSQDALPLPERSPDGDLGLPELRKPSTGGTLNTAPSGVTSPPTAGTTSAPRRPGGPGHARWRYLPSSPTPKVPLLSKKPPKSAPQIRGIILIPGVPTTDVRNGSTREFARALPVPKGFKGMRDLGTGTPKDVAHQFKKFIGKPGDQKTIDQLTEMAVFAFGASGYPIKAIHIHDVPEKDGIVRMVIVPPTTFAVR